MDLPAARGANRSATNFSGNHPRVAKRRAGADKHRRVVVVRLSAQHVCAIIPPRGMADSAPDDQAGVRDRASTSSASASKSMRRRAAAPHTRQVERHGAYSAAKLLHLRLPRPRRPAHAMQEHDGRRAAVVAMQRGRRDPFRGGSAHACLHARLPRTSCAIGRRHANKTRLYEKEYFSQRPGQTRAGTPSAERTARVYAR